jgi:undecaprenyl pyrophosphate phosphatase UppP
MSHLTYAEAVITGLIQGVTELFPVSSLGHNVLLPALIGGHWASDLSVSAPGSPYLAFIVGLHVATALAMIAYFWRDWVRIVRGFVSSISRRQIVTPDQRLAWMIVLATIPVGIAGAALQKVFTHVFAKPELTAVFLAVNGLILLYCERQRRARAGRGSGSARPAAAGAGTPAVAGSAFGGPAFGGPAQGGYEGYSQQPQQQQWQGPDPRYGQDDWQNGPDARHGAGAQYGQDPWPGQAPQHGQAPQYGQAPQHGQAPWDGDAPWGGALPPQQPDQRHAQAPWGGQDSRDGRASQDAFDPWGGRDDRTVGGLRLTQAPGGRQAAQRAAAPSPQTEAAVAADRRLSLMGWGRAILVGSAQILALLPGISRDGIVTVAGMGRGLSREDAVRFSFLLSAPVILAAGVLKAHDLLGPAGKGIHGPVLVGSLLAGVGAFLSVRFLTKYFSESRSLTPFGIYCLAAGVLSFAYLVIK